MHLTTKQEAEQRFLVAALRNGVTVKGTYINSDTPVACVCSNGHDCFPRPHNIQTGQGWCLSCVGHDPDAAERNFLIAAARNGVTVKGVYTYSHTPIACICLNGHECFPTPNHIQQGRGWCLACTGQNPVVAERNFLIAAARDGVTVKGAYINSSTPVLCVCSNGHDCSPRPNTIQSGKGWCEQCRGYNFNQLYLMKFQVASGAWFGKIGVASGPVRLRTHVARGLNLVKSWPLECHVAKAIEKAVKQKAQKEGWVQATREQLPDGYTETFPWERVVAIKRLIIRAIREAEQDAL